MFTNIYNTDNSIGCRFELPLNFESFADKRIKKFDKIFFVQIVKDNICLFKNGDVIRNIDRPETARYELLNKRLTVDENEENAGWAIDQTIYEKLDSTISFCNIDPRYVAKRIEPKAGIKILENQYNNYMTIPFEGKPENPIIQFGDEPQIIIEEGSHIEGSMNFHLALFIERGNYTASQEKRIELHLFKPVFSWGFKVEWKDNKHILTPYEYAIEEKDKERITHLFKACMNKWNTFIVEEMSNNNRRDLNPYREYPFYKFSDKVI